jgi:hypothetical protein
MFLQNRLSNQMLQYAEKQQVFRSKSGLKGVTTQLCLGVGCCSLSGCVCYIIKISCRVAGKVLKISPSGGLPSKKHTPLSRPGIEIVSASCYSSVCFHSCFFLTLIMQCRGSNPGSIPTISISFFWWYFWSYETKPLLCSYLTSESTVCTKWTNICQINK